MAWTNEQYTLTTVFTGRLSKDAEIEQVGESQVLKLSVPLNGYVRNSDTKPTLWLNITSWNKRDINNVALLKKGKVIMVTASNFTVSKSDDGRVNYGVTADSINPYVVPKSMEAGLVESSAPSAAANDDLDF